jgi:oxalate decarboxylase
MSGGIMQLNPGALRELHWHPNADEWLYVISGKIRLTVFASSGLASVTEISEGEVAYTPMGYGHSIENTGDEVCKLIIVFNSGVYEEIALNSWLASVPKEIVTANLNLPLKVVESFSGKEFFIVGKNKN